MNDSNTTGLEVSSVLKRFRSTWIAVVVLAMLANVLMLTPTLYMLNIYDRVFVSQSAWTLITMSVLALGLLSVMALAEWMRSQQLVRLSQALDAWLSDQVFHANYLGQLTNRTYGDSNKAFADVTELRQFITGQGIFAFLDAPWTPIYIGVLFLLHPALGWAAIGFLLLQVTLAAFSYRLNQPLSEEAGRQQQRLAQLTSTHMRELEASHAMGERPTLWSRWQSATNDLAHAHSQSQSRVNVTTALSKWLRYAQQSMVLGLGALLVINDQLSAGAMIASNVLALRALTPIDQMVQAWRPFLGAKQAYKRLQGLLASSLQSSVREADTQTCVTPVNSAEAWVLENVSVHVAQRDQPLLEDINLCIKTGRLLVVLGASGSGKTTLARALVGVCAPDEGRITLAGQPLQAWISQHSQTPIGYLPQDIELFDGSVAENIARLGEVNAQAVIQAAQASGLHDSILRMSQGYDTPIGQGGRTLSGGQRQRIALARALYQSPPYIVLDEPNAHLDDQGESALTQTLTALKATQQTVVLITHRPQVLAIADDVLVLHQGRVHLHGTKAEVLAQLKGAGSTTSTNHDL